MSALIPNPSAPARARMPRSLCQHPVPCPTADSPDREAATVVNSHPEQGWSLLCNGIFLFEDTGELLPDGSVVDPHRPAPAAGVLIAA